MEFCICDGLDAFMKHSLFDDDWWLKDEALAFGKVQKSMPWGEDEVIVDDDRDGPLVLGDHLGGDSSVHGDGDLEI